MKVEHKATSINLSVLDEKHNKSNEGVLSLFSYFDDDS